ncbi:hypothetical protein AG0111_0g8982 [Alternaria gaisen]|uniref:Uncharacterized protein n=1 Tax=Alternaria gaisen TaxID=167740 RepID=A0ACB6FES2_9PLEO|nr:hypothetical protein AG0111_0g8982 [Alternaria gaisen]
MFRATIIPRLQESLASSALGDCSFLELTIFIISLAITLGSFRAVYLVYFHPLASFPGPYKAIFSSWWQYPLSKHGTIEEVLEHLHRTYNTRVLRIGPNELHITDPMLYHTIYSQRYTFPKQKSFYDAFNTPHSVFVEHDGELHRARRKLLSNFFSKSSVRAMNKILLTKVTIMCDRIAEMKGNGAINLYHAFRCLTVDFITEVAFGESFNLITESEDNTFNTLFIECFDLASESLWDLLFFPFIRIIVNKCPPAVAAKLSEPAAKFQGLLRAVAATVANFRRLKSSGKRLDREIVFDAMQHLDDKLVQAEASDILIAGSDTTATTLAVAVQAIIENPTIFKKLRNEMKDAGITAEHDFDLLRLEQLPYLTACVKEALRCAMAVPGRLPRVVPDGTKPLVVDEKVIPVGTIVGMSAYSMHYNESIWGEDAREFNPSRWLAADAKDLEKYLVTFSKGARQCLGINIAYAEITLTLAMLVARYRFTIDETVTKSDVRQLDYFVSAFEGTGIRTYVHEDKL